MRWMCGRCFYREDAPPSALAPMHACSGLGGLSVPLAVEGERVQHRTNVRDLAVAPVMSVTTEHMDGREDCTVYPVPLAFPVVHLGPGG